VKEHSYAARAPKGDAVVTYTIRRDGGSLGGHISVLVPDPARHAEALVARGRQDLLDAMKFEAERIREHKERFSFYSSALAHYDEECAEVAEAAKKARVAEIRDELSDLWRQPGSVPAFLTTVARYIADNVPPDAAPLKADPR
jgi:hypothetical protein